MKYLPLVRVKSSPSLLGENIEYAWVGCLRLACNTNWLDYDNAMDEEGNCELRPGWREEIGCKSS